MQLQRCISVMDLIIFQNNVPLLFNLFSDLKCFNHCKCMPMIHAYIHTDSICPGKHIESKIVLRSAETRLDLGKG